MVNRFFYPKYDIEYSFVRSFWAWRFCKNLEEESSFKQKTWQYEAPEIKDSKVSVKYRRICKVIVTKDEDAKVSFKKTYKNPSLTPDKCSYAYNDVTCDEGCAVTEGIYWSLTSYLGG